MPLLFSVSPVKMESLKELCGTHTPPWRSNIQLAAPVNVNEFMNFHLLVVFIWLATLKETEILHIAFKSDFSSQSSSPI